MLEREPPKQGDNLSKPLQSAFNGDVEFYNIKSAMEIDLLAYLTSVKPDIDEIGENKTRHEAHKTQLTAELKLMKSRVDEADKHTTIFAKTDLKTVYYDGLSEDEFSRCFSKLFASWTAFHRMGVDGF